jgi:predicted RNA-binding Zn ribbon-like protein
LEKKLNFVNRYGFLHGDTYQAESTRLMTLSVQRAAEMVAMVDARKWSELESYLRGLGSGMYSIGIAPPERSGRPALKFFPFNLFLAATAQLLEEAASGGQFKSCIRPGCGRYFGYGPGTGRRETALYCSPRCQKAHDYQKRKEAQR